MGVCAWSTKIGGFFTPLLPILNEKKAGSRFKPFLPEATIYVTAKRFVLSNAWRFSSVQTARGREERFAFPKLFQPSASGGIKIRKYANLPSIFICFF